MAKDNAERKAVEDFLAMSRGNCEVNEMAFVEMIKMIRFIYEEMLRRLEVEPGEVVLVDDRADNIAAAAAMGIHVLWFIDAVELGRQLEVYLDHSGVAGDSQRGGAAQTG